MPYVSENMRICLFVEFFVMEKEEPLKNIALGYTFFTPTDVTLQGLRFNM
jgi:hypothetical protein